MAQTLTNMNRILYAIHSATILNRVEGYRPQLATPVALLNQQHCYVQAPPRVTSRLSHTRTFFSGLGPMSLLSTSMLVVGAL